MNADCPQELYMEVEVEEDEDESCALTGSSSNKPHIDHGKNRYKKEMCLIITLSILITFIFPLGIHVLKMHYSSFSSEPDFLRTRPLFSKDTDSTSTMEGCHGLDGMRVLLVSVHFEGNLGDELETTPLLKELKRCKVVTIAVLSRWIDHPKRLSPRSVREHSLVDEIISDYDSKLSMVPQPKDLPPTLKYDAVILAPGPQSFRYALEPNYLPIDIHFGGSLTEGSIGCPIPKNVSLVVVREPESIHCMERSGSNKNHTAILYMMGDLAMNFQPSWAVVEFWREFYAKEYKHISNILYVRDRNFDNAVQFVDKNTKLDLKPLQHRQSDRSTVVLPLRLNCSEVLFVSDSPVEDQRMLNLQKGNITLPGLQKDQFLMLDTIEQMIAITQHVKNIYTDRYHPGVLGYRFGKKVQLLDLKFNQKTKLYGLQELMQEFPDPKVVQQERIPIAFEKMRDTLRLLRKKREVK